MRESYYVKLSSGSMLLVTPEMEDDLLRQQRAALPWWRRLRVRPFFAWYDLWVGVFVDRQAGAVYLCPLPMVGVKVMWR